MKNLKDKIRIILSNYKSDIFAVFVVAPIEDGFAATTRPNSKKIGLPGGKVDPNETPSQALIRECKEEGFAISGIEKEPFYVDIVEGKKVAWYRAREAKMLDDFKEKGRITPVISTKEDIASSGMGNDKAMGRY